MAVTEKERMLKIEHDAWLSTYYSRKNDAAIDYIAMMSDIDIKSEEENDEEQEI